MIAAVEFAMIRCRSALIISAILGCWSVVSVKAATCSAHSAEGCVSKTNIDQLLEINNQSLYCPSAAVLAYEINACLAECNFSPSQSIQNFFSQIENTCSVITGCQDIVGLYSNFSSCFDKFGGLDSLINRIISAFNSKESTRQICLLLAEGKSCLKSFISSCVFLIDLNQAIYTSCPELSYVQHICGSENVPYIADDSTCDRSAEMNSKIQHKCNISCSIASTVDPDTMCQFLQDQVNCILGESSGCIKVEIQFLRPRLSTYSIVNTVLECPRQIKVRGVTVQPAGLSPDYQGISRCNYISQINTCFKLNLTKTSRADSFLRLLIGDFDLKPLCKSISTQQQQQVNPDNLVGACANSFMSCPLPVSEVYEAPSQYDNSYDSSLGPVLLDSVGLQTILSTLSCPNPNPPTICPNRPTSPSGLNRLARSMTPALTRRPTPTPRRGRNTPGKTRS